MVRDRFIICVASRWDLDPTSKHHLMRILSRGNDVLWVNYHGSRLPRLTRSDTRSVLNALRRVFEGVRPIGDRMNQITPLVLPGAPNRWRSAINRRLLVGQLRRAVARRRRRDQPVQLWTFAPDVAHLAGAFDEECLVYYCVDDFSRFEGFDRKAMAAAERNLIAAADIVITSSAKLHEERVTLHENVHLVRHGVDHDHFATALDGRRPCPEPLNGIPRPIAGFIGLVQHWFDVRLLCDVARRLPEMSFVIVGDHQVDVSELKALPNVHFVGRQPYAMLPAYCAAFDVALIPFVRSAMTANVNPIKLREYLAAGLPVVSTSLPEVSRFTPHVTLADDADEFARACLAAIQSDSPQSRRARSAAVADQAWEGVTEHVAGLVHATTRRRRSAPAAAPVPVALA